MQDSKWNQRDSDRKDYLGNTLWWDLSKRYALAQLDFPEGLGMNRTLEIKKRLMIGWLTKIPPEKLQELIDEFRREYSRLKQKHDRGERVEPDIMPPQKHNMATTRAREQRSRGVILR
jgi:hypothetical protein